MGKLWRKVKVALGLNLCVYPPRNYVADNDDDHEETLPPSAPPSERLSNAEVTSPPLRRASAPSTPVSSKLRISKSLSRSSSKKICSICLASMRQGDGHAIFTAECSHSFHFHCVTSNVKHGNQICPVCRAKWKEIPLQAPSLNAPLRRARTNSINWPNNNEFMTMLRRLPPPRSNSARNATPLPQTPEPPVFDDDELLDHHYTDLNSLNKISTDHEAQRKLNLKTFLELPAVARSNTLDSFTVLLNLKAPCSNSSRAPVDLVTVLDISGSMVGSKLALLKRAVGFVIQNLGPNDRLAVITFSATARRLFPLRKMSEGGRLQALLAVNALVANGGTNIAEGLRKAVKTVEDRREKNPIASIILLSDGQDTYMVNNLRNTQLNNYESLLPLSVRPGESSGVKIPIHSFGFGADHDASSMHSVSESSGGTFSFIETEGAIQDAFAQCIGGILSIVVKDLQVRVESVDLRIFLGSFKAGSYPNRISSDQRTGSIDVGDLYADEEKDFLVSLNIPSDILSGETSLLMIKCIYNDPLTKESVTLEGLHVRVLRTEVGPGRESVSIEVDRQQNRIRAAEAMADARTAAENGDLAVAVSLLENCRKVVSESVSGKCRDSLCVGLDGELKEMQERMASRHMYEASGRAFILSGLSSHTWQRATARGDSDSQFYQTQSMAEMVNRSQAETPSTQRLLQASAAQLNPR